MNKGRETLVLEDLIGRRFSCLDALKVSIEFATDREVSNIQLSESENIDGCDNMIDYCFKDNIDDVKTIFYLKDNADNFYITEV